MEPTLETKVCSADKERLSFPPLAYRTGPAFARAQPSGFWFLPLRSLPRKCLALRNPGNLRTLRKSRCLWKVKPRKNGLAQSVIGQKPPRLPLLPANFAGGGTPAGSQIRRMYGFCVTRKRLYWPSLIRLKTLFRGSSPSSDARRAKGLFAESQAS
jgi:hypothetical protein